MDKKVRLSVPGASARTVITTFSGIRAHEKGGDFIIRAVEGAPRVPLRPWASSPG